MFWDNIAGVYDIFEKVINKKTNQDLCVQIEKLISESDTVLECACGTGLLSGVIAKKCTALVATDFSAKMLERAKNKHREHTNIEFKQGNILQIEYPDENFDVVVAANVIHLLDEPYKALSELDRVCRKNGKIIIPTYMNKNNKGKTGFFATIIGKIGANFKQQFTLETYKQFIENARYKNVEYTLVKGKIPCAIAVIKKIVQ